MPGATTAFMQQSTSMYIKRVPLPLDARDVRVSRRWYWRLEKFIFIIARTCKGINILQHTESGTIATTSCAIFQPQTNNDVHLAMSGTDCTILLCGMPIDQDIQHQLYKLNLPRVKVQHNCANRRKYIPCLGIHWADCFVQGLVMDHVLYCTSRDNGFCGDWTYGIWRRSEETYQTLPAVERGTEAMLPKMMKKNDATNKAIFDPCLLLNQRSKNGCSSNVNHKP